MSRRKKQERYLEDARFYFEENRLNNTESIAELTGKTFLKQSSRAKSELERARAVWREVNGRREREHTTAVFLKESKVAGAAPILGIYVDSSVFVAEWHVNREMYLGRLAMADFSVSGIEFLLSKDQFVKEKQQDIDEDRLYKPIQQLQENDLPPLSAKDALWIEEQIACLDPELQDKARCAMSLIIRRHDLGDALSHK